MKQNGTERDIFARSAYNRYYYSAFLVARELLTSIDPTYDKIGHKGYPDILKGTITKKLRQEQRTARKISDSELVNKIQIALAAIQKLSELMTDAYATRVAADYRPDIEVRFIDGERFELAGVNITIAHRWNEEAIKYKNIILDTWKQINA